MNTAIEYLKSWFSIVPRMTFLNVCEIIIIAFLVYALLKWIRDSHAWVLLRGIVIILLFTLICAVFRFDTILWILGKIATIAVMALIVIFQPELRTALERIGSNSMLDVFKSTPVDLQSFSEKTVEEISKAAFDMSKTKTGALIVIERKESLKEIESTGIAIDGLVSSQLLINIFEHNTPLHDGAVVIRGNIITAATCYLPLSDNRNINKALGTRHRAAIGISETTDSLTIVVSEETGAVSAVEHGTLTEMKTPDALKKVLRTVKEVPENRRFHLLKGRNSDERKADQKPDA